MNQQLYIFYVMFILLRCIIAFTHNNSFSSIDEVVLAYVISMFQNLSSGASFEEDVDVDYFIEMMDAYLPGFGEIDR